MEDPASAHSVLKLTLILAHLFMVKLANQSTDNFEVYLGSLIHGATQPLFV